MKKGMRTFIEALLEETRSRPELLGWTVMSTCVDIDSLGYPCIELSLACEKGLAEEGRRKTLVLEMCNDSDGLFEAMDWKRAQLVEQLVGAFPFLMIRDERRC